MYIPKWLLIIFMVYIFISLLPSFVKGYSLIKPFIKILDKITTVISIIVLLGGGFLIVISTIADIFSFQSHPISPIDFFWLHPFKTIISIVYVMSIYMFYESVIAEKINKFFRKNKSPS